MEKVSTWSCWMRAPTQKCSNAYRSSTWNKVIRRSTELTRRRRMTVRITRTRGTGTRLCTIRLAWCSLGPRWTRKGRRTCRRARPATAFQTSRCPLSNRWRLQLSHPTYKPSGKARTTSTPYSRVTTFPCFLTIRLLRPRNNWRQPGPASWKTMIRVAWPSRVISNQRRPWSVVPKPPDSPPRSRWVSRTRRGWVRISRDWRRGKWSTTIVITKAQSRIQTTPRKWWSCLMQDKNYEIKLIIGW